MATRSLSPHECRDAVCDDLREAIDHLAARHGVMPVGGEQDMKSGIVDVYFDQRLSEAALSDAIALVQGREGLECDAQGILCRPHWCSIGRARTAATIAAAPAPARGAIPVLGLIRRWFGGSD